MKSKKTVICVICNNEYNARGFHNHITQHHHMSLDEYKKLDYNHPFKDGHEPAYHRKKEKRKCLICGAILESESLLSYHIRLLHHMDKLSYIIKYELNGIIPVCKCGCGKNVKILKQPPYKRDYIIGHNDNPMIGRKHTKKSKNMMSKSAKNRINQDKTNGIITSWHSPTAIKKRSMAYSAYWLSKKLDMYNVTLLCSHQDYIDNKIKFKCNVCGRIQEQNHKSYLLCDKCYPRVRSAAQTEVAEFIESLGINVVLNTKSVIKNKELDIYLPDYKLAIEYDGLYWHSLIADNKYHINKSKECEQIGIQLIHIFEDEWIFKQEIVKSRLLHIVNKTHNKIYARKCKIVKLTKKEKDEFLELNHIQGKDISSIYYGLMYDDSIVSLMTFSKPRIISKTKELINTFELVRYASHMNYNIVGGASKLLNKFIIENKPSKIISYADRRWTTTIKETVYDKLGFIKVKETVPDYWYIKSQRRLHRFNFAKHRLVKMGYDKNKTESQIMKEIGYGKIYDCGSLKYEMKFD